MAAAQLNVVEGMMDIDVGKHVPGRLKGKVAIITGGAGEIATATAARFVAEGGRVLLVDMNEAGLKQNALDFAGAAGILIEDVSRAESGKVIVDAAISKFGRIDIGVLNAATEGRYGSIVDTPLQEFDRVMVTNVRSVWIGLAAIMPAMKRTGGGSIIITCSTAGLRGSAGMGSYVTSKHALIGMMRTAALEGARDGIRVNTVHPSQVDTRMQAEVLRGRNPGDPQGARRIAEASIPLGRFGTAREVASLMTFLASDEASYCTGGMHTVDGGTMAGQVRR